MDSASQKTTPIIFKGKAAEYFGIWIVNLLLTIVTFGIYSAWAKVRRKKYFYHNTLIENVGFDYHAKPISILKGRIIAFAFFIGYSFSANINPVLPAIFMLVLFVFLPWLVVRGSIFNARNSSHRGLRFDFVGSVGQAAKVYIALPMLTFFTLGLIIPYISHEKNQFLVNNHRFGLSQFEMKRVVKQFYKVYLIFLIIPVIIGILAAIAIPAYQQYVKKAASHANENMQHVQPFVALQPNIVLAANEAPDEAIAAETGAPAPTVERVYSESAPDANGEAQLPAEIAENAPETDDEMQEQAAGPALTEAEQQKMLEEMMQKQQQESKGKLEELMKQPLYIMIYLAVFVFYAFFIFGFVGYLQARIGNLIWNNTSLDQLTFQSKLRARDFIWLYFSNIVAIVLTFGLATPWAQIRLARYRASKLSIVGDVDLDRFVGDKKAEVKATGEEIAEMFDVDLSFG